MLSDLNPSATREVIPKVLEFLPWIQHIPTVGLVNESLYEVPDVNDGTATVNAIAFNISCGYLSAIPVGLVTDSTQPNPVEIFNRTPRSRFI